MIYPQVGQKKKTYNILSLSNARDNNFNHNLLSINLRVIFFLVNLINWYGNTLKTYQ